MQTFQQFKQEFAQFEQDVLTLQLNQETENRESVRYKIRWCPKMYAACMLPQTNP